MQETLEKIETIFMIVAMPIVVVGAAIGMLVSIALAWGVIAAVLAALGLIIF